MAHTYITRNTVLLLYFYYSAGGKIELRVNTEIANLEAAPRFIATPQPITVMEGLRLVAVLFYSLKIRILLDVRRIRSINYIIINSYYLLLT